MKIGTNSVGLRRQAAGRAGSTSTPIRRPTGAASLIALLTGLLVGLSCASAVDQVQAGELAERDPQALLDRMAKAQRSVEYEGTLVYLHGRHLATLRIAHRIDNGVSMESLLALSGPIRAVARNDRGVTCMLSDAKAFSLPRGQRGGNVLRAGPIEFDHIRQNYLLHVLGQSRVAGRDTDVVGIVPRDDYRYGYRYYIDRETGLPLKVDLMNDAGEPIEQVMFTSVDTFPDDARQLGPASTPTEPPGAVGDKPAIATQDSGWKPTKMPPGFDVVTSRREGAMEHLVIGDGIASVSIYVEPAVASDGGRLVGAARMGAITAIGGRIDGHHATVVGEVPERTAQLLLDGLTPPRTAATNR